MPDKDRERHYLNTVLATLDLHGQIEEGEHPDFVVTLDGVRTGVEITVFHMPPSGGERPHQEQVALQALAVEQAHRRYVGEGGAPLYVSVNFLPGYITSKASAHSLGADLCCAIQSVRVPKELAEGRYEVPLDLLPDGIVSCSVHASCDGEDQLWQGGHGGWVAPVTPEQVQAELTRKAPKATTMRLKCDQLWLIVVQDAFAASAPCDLSSQAAEHLYSHPFDRALWLVHHDSRVLELRAARLQGSAA